eukprot:gene3066-5843_t
MSCVGTEGTTSGVEAVNEEEEQVIVVGRQLLLLLLLLVILLLLYLRRLPQGVVLWIWAVVILCTASYFGFAPRVVSIYVAKLFRFPRDAYLSLFGRSRPFNYNRISNHIIVGRMPRSLEDLQQLVKDEHIRAIVDLSESWEQFVSPSSIANMGLKRINLPTPDYHAPTVDDLITAVHFIEHSVRQGDTVYIHCNGGKGRAATVATTWLMYSENISPQKALVLLQSRRKVAQLDRLFGILPVWRVITQFYSQHCASPSQNQLGSSHNDNQNQR